MKHNFIYEKLGILKLKPNINGFARTIMLEGKLPIERVEASFNILQSGRTYHFKVIKDKQRVLFFITGTGLIQVDKKSFFISNKTVFTSFPSMPFSVITGKDDLRWIELRMELTDNDRKELEEWKHKYPFFLDYNSCELYTDRSKTVKTINRIIIPPHLVPRFAMGSVDSTGPDYIKKHAHPSLEQCFFSFAENDCINLIDAQTVDLKGNTLLYIPLGSNHGVEVREEKRMHYIWMDFFERTENMKEMIESHKLIRKGRDR